MNVTQQVDSEERRRKVTVLNRLLIACRDSRHMYGAASQDAHDPALREIFLQLAFQRGSLVKDLERAIRELGGKPREGETVVGSLLRGWMEILSGFVADHDRAVLVECERAEGRFIDAYETALSESMPIDVDIGLRRQYLTVRATRARITKLRDLRPKAQ